VSIRILHVLSADADFQLRRTSQMVARDGGADFAVDQRLLRTGPRHVTLDWLELRKRAAGRQGRASLSVDLVHAFGFSALAAAAVAGHRRILFSPMPTLGPRSLRGLRAVMAYCDVQVVCGSATQHRQLVTRGVPIERCHFIRPAVEFSRIPGRRRDPELRQRLGIAEHDLVLLAIGESTAAAEHSLAVWSCGILHVLEKRYRIVLWGRGRWAGAAMTLARRLNQRHMAIDASALLGGDVDFESLLPAADVAVLSASGAVATLPIAQTMAAAMPIVSVSNRLTTELLEDRHTALLVTHPKPRLLAQRVMDMLENPTLGWSLGDMARTEAFEYFSASRMLEAYRTVYRQMNAGEPVAVPAVEAGAGMRFHGRG
jgi:glycosyltransferase involved in cell wall biosynthesis